MRNNNVSNDRKVSINETAMRRRRTKKRRRQRREAMEDTAPVLAPNGSGGGGGEMRYTPATRENRTACPLQALKLAIKSRFLLPHTKMILGLTNKLRRG